jgi:hypothetical protein
MDLLFLLKLVAGTVGFSASAAVGRRAGGIGLSVGIISGLAIGVFCYTGMKVIIEWIPERLGYNKEGHQRFDTVIGILMILAALVWIVSSALLGIWVTLYVLRTYV